MLLGPQVGSQTALPASRSQRSWQVGGNAEPGSRSRPIGGSGSYSRCIISLLRFHTFYILNPYVFCISL